MFYGLFHSNEYHRDLQLDIIFIPSSRKCRFFATREGHNYDNWKHFIQRNKKRKQKINHQQRKYIAILHMEVDRVLIVEFGLFVQLATIITSIVWAFIES